MQSRIATSADETAYKKLFYYFHPLLRRFAFNLTGNAEVADEIVSDVLLKVWTMRRTLSEIADLKLYLFKATKNASLNYLKSAAYKQTQTTRALENGDHLFVAPDEEYACTEMQQVLLTAINQLPPKSQLVFKLVKEYGLTYNQVQQVMDISQNTIETHMRIALKKLKEAIAQYRQGF